MQTHNLGYPRIGSNRELKKASEQYWAGNMTAAQLEQAAKKIRESNWMLQKDAGIDLLPVNDFSFYDQVLDTCLMTGAIPDRYHPLIEKEQMNTLDLLFAMARGYQKNGYDLTAMEMTKWFDTNYHYIVPEFKKDQRFIFFSNKIIDQFNEAKNAGFQTRPVLLGPVTFLLLGKEKEAGFDRLDLLNNLLPVYFEVLEKLDQQGAYYIQVDEPCLALGLGEKALQAIKTTYTAFFKRFPNLRIMLTNYFDCFGANLETVLSLPVHILHLDLVRCPLQLDDILATPAFTNGRTHLSLGVVDGRNIWKNDFEQSLSLIQKATAKIGPGRIWIAPSCSLLHVPCDLDLETGEKTLPQEIKQWLAFAKQKLAEVAALKQIAANPEEALSKTLLEDNARCMKARRTSARIHHQQVKDRVAAITAADARRNSPFFARREKQQQELALPLFPTTTIGSFPQTKEVRSWRAQWKKQQLSDSSYNQLLQEATANAIRRQEAIGLDVLVHGEFERNDMVEYFGEQLAGFAFTQNGWVQSYGSRCVKPPVIYGDIYRPNPMTVAWSVYAQSLTSKHVKGMLTGPVTILQWSFVRNDQPRSLTCNQLALAIRDEVTDLEKAGIRIIQIDEPAIREGLPLRKEQQEAYLNWAVTAFRIAASGVQDQTQIHTHMCYSAFNDSIHAIAAMDADVITIETARSQMKLLDAFAMFEYPNDIGPGVYDIHSPRVPSEDEMLALLEKALEAIPAERLWVNPDCGLKTRAWEETMPALTAMIRAAKTLRKRIMDPVPE
ncbi:5-methyltetrahydropteroyltriglutamate--homocysteine S-methyltransferase [Niabella hirudinis]|uniref:5-methyltetrahydropteroyltriglutamate-- homocysteine S-methyltransferase n=1 Tax=Niabella hirudinis TaxID=1285929 RepID=UPI003EBD6251